MGRSRSVRWGVVAVLFFVVMILAILAEFHALPFVDDYGFVDDHQGGVLLAAFALVILVAGPIATHSPGETAWVPALIPAIVLVQGAALIDILRGYLTDLEEDGASFLSGQAVRWVTIAVAAGIVLAVAGKSWLLVRYSALARSAKEEPAEELLPFQAKVLHDLGDLIRGSTSQGRIVQVSGRWGEGKTVLLDHLEQELGTPSDMMPGRSYAVVTVDVWKRESEPDLHYSIYQRVLTHHCVLDGFGWLHLPVSLVPEALARMLPRDLGARIGAKASSVEVSLRLPRLLWQRQFEHTISRLWTRGTVTVIVLDEIDRASPEVAQAALTMCRRSLDRPGVVVVLSYVRPLIDYKVFNPLLPTLPDLASTMEAVLAEELMAAQVSEGSLISEPAESLAAVESCLRQLEWTRVGRELAIGGIDAADAMRPEPPGSLLDPLELPELLRRVYTRLSRAQRSRLLERFGEKYLGRDAVTLVPMAGEDVWNLVERPHLKAFTCRLCPTFTEEGKDLVTKSVDEWTSGGNRMPPIRALDSELTRLLVTRASRKQADLSATSVAATVLAAVVVASSRHQPGFEVASSG